MCFKKTNNLGLGSMCHCSQETYFKFMAVDADSVLRLMFFFVFLFANRNPLPVTQLIVMPLCHNRS